MLICLWILFVKKKKKSKIKILNLCIFQEPEVTKKPIPEVPIALPKKVGVPAVKDRMVFILNLQPFIFVSLTML